MSEAGADRLEAIERLLRILAVLDAAGAAGVRHDRLARLVAYPAGSDDPRRQLAGDVGELNRAGWEIISVGAGSGKRYALIEWGTRPPLRLDPAHEAALLRASRVAQDGRPDGEPIGAAGDALAECISAVGAGSVVSFEYAGRRRRVHPRAVQPGPSGWYLVGRPDDGRDTDEYYAVALMRDIEVRPPGEAPVSPVERRGGHDPVRWLVDSPEEVKLRTAARFADEVELAFGPALRREHSGDDVVLTIAVTHQAAFRQRLYALGGRVEVLAPQRVRAEIVAELSHLAGLP